MANGDNIKPYEFKKGQSGNPKGRPVGSKNRSTIAKKWLETIENVKNPITGEFEELTQEDIGTLALIKKMRSGDVRAYNSLMDSAFGKPNETSNITINSEQPLFDL